MAISAVHHLGLTVTAVDDSAKWYQSVLGFDRAGEYASPGGERRKVFLRHDHLGVRLGLTEHKSGPHDPFDETRVGLDHLAFRVDTDAELREWQVRLARHAVPFTPIAPANSIPGASVLVFRDPDNPSRSSLDCAAARVQRAPDQRRRGPLPRGRRKAVQFFDRPTTNLLAAERQAGIRHHVALSIVGIDRVDLGYYLGKRRQEQLVRDGDIPWTILRATQFHEFPAQLAHRVPGPLLPVPSMTTQPIAAREVAQVLTELALAEPAGRVMELAGPEVHQMPDLARRLLRARGSHRAVLPVRLPGRVGRALAGDGLLPLDGGRRGTQTFGELLNEARCHDRELAPRHARTVLCDPDRT